MCEGRRAISVQAAAISSRIAAKDAVGDDERAKSVVVDAAAARISRIVMEDAVGDAYLAA